MNYRHAFHAGNFADLVKHAALLAVLSELKSGSGGAPLSVVDTHAGRGLYDLGGAEARRSGEAEAGVARLMAGADAPDAIQPLIAGVRALNPGPAVTRYPGSPWLIAEAMRRGDHYTAFELRVEEHAALAAVMAGRPGVRTLNADGYAGAAGVLPTQGPALVLIDPPFERADDYARIVETLTAVRRRNARSHALVWLPIKDLGTLDAFLCDLEDAKLGEGLVAEARLRPLNDPMKMNGCALVWLGPIMVQPTLEAICGWVVEALGDSGQSKVYPLASD